MLSSARFSSSRNYIAKALNADDADQTDFRGFFIRENPRQQCNPRSKKSAMVLIIIVYGPNNEIHHDEEI